MSYTLYEERNKKVELRRVITLTLLALVIITVGLSLAAFIKYRRAVSLGHVAYVKRLALDRAVTERAEKIPLLVQAIRAVGLGSSPVVSEATESYETITGTTDVDVKLKEAERMLSMFPELMALVNEAEAIAPGLRLSNTIEDIIMDEAAIQNVIADYNKAVDRISRSRRGIGGELFVALGGGGEFEPFVSIKREPLLKDLKHPVQ